MPYNSNPTQYALQAPGDHDQGPLLKYFRERERLRAKGGDQEQRREATKDARGFRNFLEREWTQLDPLDHQNSGEGEAAYSFQS